MHQRVEQGVVKFRQDTASFSICNENLESSAVIGRTHPLSWIAMTMKYLAIAGVDVRDIDPLDVMLWMSMEVSRYRAHLCDRQDLYAEWQEDYDSGRTDEEPPEWLPENDGRFHRLPLPREAA